MKCSLAIAAAVLGITVLFCVWGGGCSRAGLHSGPAEGGWTDLLGRVDAKKHARVGAWSRQGRAIRYDGPSVGGHKRPQILVPQFLTGSYEIRISFVRNSGGGFIGIVLPVGGGGVKLVLDAKGVSGLAMVNGRKASENKTGIRTGDLVNGKKHTVRATVLVSGKEAEITVLLDGKEIIHWAGPRRALTIARVVAWRDARYPGLVALSPTTFYAMRLRSFD